MDFFNNETRNYIIYTVIFFVLGILCFGWAYHINQNAIDTGVTLHELIAKGSRAGKKIVSLTVTEKPYVFAEYDDNPTSAKYYFLMDENYLYIGYLDYDTYSKLNQDDITENPITIKGVTKIIPDDVIDIALNVYNKNLDEDFLTKENYKSYIGEIYIDTVSNLIDNIFQIILGFIFCFIAIIYLIIYYVRNRKIKRSFK